jgi:hypothetical protein
MRVLVLIALLFAGCTGSEPLFLKRSDTGIDFQNTLYFTEDFNPYTYRNFFNGGGVALGDINNDGLVDIYFTGNLVSNRLYLNKGDFQFEDITEMAGVSCESNWSAGSTFVDINNDGFLDLYVAKSGKPGGERRYNELFINNGDLTFTESAAVYGLNITGLSVQAAFFDYDGDEDLDVYLLNNSIRSVGAYDLIEGQREIASEDGNQLLENRDGFFVPVSAEEGVYSSAIGFGLGITLSDFNGDHWPDLFISNDYFEKDYLYINQDGNGFQESSDSYFDALSMGSMGADAADLDNDLRPDIMVTEMLPETLARQKSKQVFESWDKFQLAGEMGYHKQYSRNVLQRNLDNRFYEVGRQLGVSATEWSWASLLFDMDNDGYRDIYVSNGIFKDLLDRDYLTYNANEESLRQQMRQGEEAVTALIDLMPSSAVPNAVYRNRGDFTFENVRQLWGLDEASFSNGSAYGDLDNDGDLDLIVNNIDADAFVYENRSERLGHHFLAVELKGTDKNRFAIGAKVQVYLSDGSAMMAEQYPSRGFESSVPNRLHFGLGNRTDIDSVEVIWPNRMRSVHKVQMIDQILTIDYNPSEVKPISSDKTDLDTLLTADLSQKGINYQHQENRYIDFDVERMLPQYFSNEGPAMATADLNGDGLDDIFLGGAKGQSAELYLSSSSGYSKSTEPFEAHKNSEDIQALFFDADGDGDQDLYVASGGRAFSQISTDLKDRLYLNTGSGVFEYSKQSALPLFSGGAVAAADVDLDGDLDLWVANRFDTRTYGLPVNSSLLINNGNGQFTPSATDSFNQLGMVTTAVFADMNADERPDLIVGGEWMPITVFYNTASGWVKSEDHPFASGMWRSITTLDLNGDGLIDIVAGNSGRNGFYKPKMRVYVNDFDRNGRVEQIYAYEVDGEYYPIHDKDELIKQLPGLKKKLLYYADYANASMSDLFSEELLGSALVLELDTTDSMIFLSSKEGYESIPLKDEAQYSSVYAIEKGPQSNSSATLYLGGNQYGFKPQYGAYDASSGWRLDLNYENELTQEIRPLNISGQIRQLRVIKADSAQDSLILLAAINNQSIQSIYVQN